MKAIVLESFGGPEQLHLTEVRVPEPGPTRIRVRVRAVGVNPTPRFVAPWKTPSPPRCRPSSEPSSQASSTQWASASTVPS